MKAAALLLLLAPAAASAEVRSSSPAGFESVARVIVAATPAEAYFMLSRIGQWWSSGHTYSGDSANLTLTARAGGCFCETVPSTGATIEHGRVVQAQPNRLLRLHAALGPLQGEAVNATLTWDLKEVSGGTEIVQTYVVGGFARGGLASLAKPVDGVVSEALDNLKSRLAAGTPPPRGGAAN